MYELEKQIIEISYRNKLSHIGSCLTALPIILDIYEQKKHDDIFVLSSGHAHLAHAVVMEKYGIISDAEKNIQEHGIHCERAGGCDASTGSLGHGIGIGLGMALSGRTVHCLTTDGEWTEGSVKEAITVSYQEEVLGRNFFVHMNWNGWSAYQSTEHEGFFYFISNFRGIKLHNTKMNSFFPAYLQGQSAHYTVLNEEQYKEIMKILT